MPTLRSVLAGVIVGVLLSSACSPPPEPPVTPQPPSEQAAPPAPGSVDERRGGTLRVGLTLDPYTLDPRFLADEHGQLIADALFDPLVRLDEHFEVVAGAAERWEMSEDGTELTFHLREASFHDGTPVTAEDFVRTFVRIADGAADPRSFLAYLLAPVAGFDAAQAGDAPLEGVEALDARTLRIRLSVPDRSFLTTLADPSLVPVPVTADDDPEVFAEQPVGNGPFQMSEPRERDAFLRLRRNPDHHTPPLLDEVLLQIYQEDLTRDRQWDDLLDGQLQVAEVPPERRDEAIDRFGRADDGASGPGFVEGLTSAVYLYGFDVTQPPFDLPEVRRAISLAIDREALAEDVMLGSRVPATAVIPPSLPGAQAGACGYCRHDPEAARVQFELAKQRVAADARDDADPADPDVTGSVADDEEAATDAPDADRAAETAADGGAQDRSDEDGAGDEEAGRDEVGTEAAGTEGLDTGETATEAATEGADLEDEGLGETDGDGGEEGDPDQSTEEMDPPLVLERLTLTHNRGRTHAAIAQRMAADIEDALGVEVDLDARELEPFLHAVSAGQVPVFRLGWDPAEPQPGSYLRPLFHSSQIGVDNLMRYSSEDVDRYLDEAQAAVFPPVAEAWYRQAERRVLEDLPAMPLLWYRHQRVIAPEVRDLRISPLGRMSFAEAWLDAGPSGG
jgi:ABC-type transport system substrate-binding protein